MKAKLLSLLLALFLYSAVSAQLSHTILIEYWQDATVIDTSGAAYTQCRCLMGFTQTIQTDYNSYVTADTAFTAIMDYNHSSPWMFKEAQCKSKSGKYNIFFNPWAVKIIFLR